LKEEEKMTYLEKILAEIRQYPREEVAYKSGVSLGTLNTLLSGANTNPTTQTVARLIDFLEGKKNELY